MRCHYPRGCSKLLESIQKALGSIVLLEISNVGPYPSVSDTIAGAVPRIQYSLRFKPFQPSTIACNDHAVRKMGISAARTAVFEEIARQQGRSPERLVRLRPLVQLLAKRNTFASMNPGHPCFRKPRIVLSSKRTAEAVSPPI
jgi:hypothetical protein